MLVFFHITFTTWFILLAYVEWVTERDALVEEARKEERSRKSFTSEQPTIKVPIEVCQSGRLDPRPIDFNPRYVRLEECFVQPFGLYHWP